MLIIKLWFSYINCCIKAVEFYRSTRNALKNLAVSWERSVERLGPLCMQQRAVCGIQREADLFFFNCCIYLRQC